MHLLFACLQVALQLILRSSDELERAGASHLMHSFCHANSLGQTAVLSTVAASRKCTPNVLSRKPSAACDTALCSVLVMYAPASAALFDGCRSKHLFTWRISNAAPLSPNMLGKLLLGHVRMLHCCCTAAFLWACALAVQPRQGKAKHSHVTARLCARCRETAVFVCMYMLTAVLCLYSLTVVCVLVHADNCLCL
jgi:hypothetical protein